MKTYRRLQAEAVTRDLFARFVRHQNVVTCWRQGVDGWCQKDDPFIDDWSEADYRVLIEDLKATACAGGFVYGAFVDEALKGFVSVRAGLFGGAEGYLDLAHIYVSEEWRRSGIDTTLFAAAKRWAEGKGAKKLYISAHSAVESQAFYRKMGCVEAAQADPAHVEAEPFDCQLEYVL